jgi:hypothetical protein
MTERLKPSNDGLERIWDLLKSALLRGQVSLFAGQWESASIANIGFIGFFVFMLSMGIALLRRRSQPDELTQASA